MPVQQDVPPGRWRHLRDQGVWGAMEPKTKVLPNSIEEWLCHFQKTTAPIDGA